MTQKTSNPWNLSVTDDSSNINRPNYDSNNGTPDQIVQDNSSNNLQGNSGTTQPEKDMTGSVVNGIIGIGADITKGVLNNQSIDNAHKDAQTMAGLEQQDITKQQDFDKKTLEQKQAQDLQQQKQKELEYKMDFQFSTWLVAFQKEQKNQEYRGQFVEQMNNKFKNNQALTTAAISMWRKR